ncbi:glycosyltransferase [Indioceanicola profundi]|uniref:glycosyltransferase n=1 Tax=Indioceanicola profundi TaxID=2220096 RepID=UPI000E6ADFEA|nr:glycosyltransferase family A protein [Indioceanicola profundi]
MNRKPASYRQIRPVHELDGPDITAIVCTGGGSPWLERSLSSLMHQAMPPGLLEIIVVDTAPDGGGHVQRLTERLAGGDGRVRYLHDPASGAARAFNTGWQAARSPIVAYLGEEAIAHPAWLAELFGAFADMRTKPGVVGGKVEGDWTVECPGWLPKSLLPWLPVLDLGDRSYALSAPDVLSATNLAFRRDLLVRIGGFRETAPDGGADAEELLHDAAGRIGELNAIYYCPRAVTRHRVGHDRVNKEWFLAQAARRGRAEALAELDGRDLPRAEREALARRRLRQFRLLRDRLRILLSREDQPATFQARCEVARARGYAEAMRGAVPQSPLPSRPEAEPADF